MSVNWLCSLYKKYAPPHYRGGETGVTQGLRIALSCSVQPYCVHARKRKAILSTSKASGEGF
jgi:hypothetical protein